MDGNRGIVRFELSDGLDPIVIQKLNTNFRQVGRESSRVQVDLAEAISSIAGKSYNTLKDKPSIEGVVLEGDKTFPELTIFIDPDDDPVTEHPSSDDYALTSSEITALWNAAS